MKSSKKSPNKSKSKGPGVASTTTTTTTTIPNTIRMGMDNTVEKQQANETSSNPLDEVLPSISVPATIDMTLTTPGIGGSHTVRPEVGSAEVLDSASRRSGRDRERHRD